MDKKTNPFSGGNGSGTLLYPSDAVTVFLNHHKRFCQIRFAVGFEHFFQLGVNFVHRRGQHPHIDHAAPSAMHKDEIAVVSVTRDKNASLLTC